MHNRPQIPLNPSEFASWAVAVDGFYRTVELARGGRYVPSFDAEFALAFAFSDLSHAISDALLSPGIIASDLCVLGVDCRALNPLFAARDIHVVELDIKACRWLMTRSARFRALFARAMTIRLRQIHDRRTRSRAGKPEGLHQLDRLLSEVPVPPLH
ncbi:MAG: hypothetical protein AB3N11_03485 [Arenibacterium sp.]